MRILNDRLTIPTPGPTNRLAGLAESLMSALGPCAYPLRFSIVEVSGATATIEVTYVKYRGGGEFESAMQDVEILKPRKKRFQSPSFAVVQIVPTGIRCSFGGYAGDAAPVTNLLATVSDFVVTHPNAVNASDINEMAPNVLYVEGKALDDFMLGRLGLRPRTGNRIGTFVDPTGASYRDEIMQVLNAARASAGIDCELCAFIGKPLRVTSGWSASGSASGTIGDPSVMLQGVKELISRGATAVGGLSVIHGVDEATFQSYIDGRIPNPSGAVEAIITHLVSKVFRVPAAHAPLPYYLDQRDPSTSNPRAAAEFISRPHYFSVLKGLHRAPQLAPDPDLNRTTSDIATVNNVGAIVVPASALGGVPILAAELSQIPIIAVVENETVLNVTNDLMQLRNVIEVESYLEAAGVISAIKAGIALESLNRPLRPVRLENNRPEKRVNEAKSPRPNNAYNDVPG